MVNVNANLDDLLKLPMKIMVALSIGSGIILFSSDKVIEKIYMLKFREDFGFIIGLLFVISSAIVLCNLAVFTVKKIVDKMNETKNNVVDIKNLTSDEREIINKFYNKVSLKYTKKAVEINSLKYSQVLDSLIARNIIKDMNELELINAYTGSGVLYELTEEAILKLNKKKQVI